MRAFRSCRLHRHDRLASPPRRSSVRLSAQTSLIGQKTTLKGNSARSLITPRTVCTQQVIKTSNYPREMFKTARCSERVRACTPTISAMLCTHALIDAFPTVLAPLRTRYVGQSPLSSMNGRCTPTSDSKTPFPPPRPVENRKFALYISTI